MDRKGFGDFLRERKLAEEQVASFVALVEEYESAATAASTVENVHAFSRRLIQQGRNEFDSFRALLLYGRFSGNNDLFVAVVELIDGGEVLHNLYGKVGRAVGQETRDHIFAGIDLPPLGEPSVDRPAIMHTVMERLEAAVEPALCREILAGGLRDLDDAWYLEGREQYRESGGMDAYLERKGQQFVAELEQLKAADRPYFTQPITDEVIEFVRSCPEIRQGVREGDVLYEVKIPYMAAAWLVETDERKKRYLYCHCPWVREALRKGDPEVSPIFCLCSAGFHKKPWEVIFGQPLEAEIVESVLQGDRWCRIAVHLPEGWDEPLQCA